MKKAWRCLVLWSFIVFSLQAPALGVSPDWSEREKQSFFLSGVSSREARDKILSNLDDPESDGSSLEKSFQVTCCGVSLGLLVLCVGGVLYCLFSQKGQEWLFSVLSAQPESGPFSSALREEFQESGNTTLQRVCVVYRSECAGSLTGNQCLTYLQDCFMTYRNSNGTLFQKRVTDTTDAMPFIKENGKCTSLEVVCPDSLSVFPKKICRQKIFCTGNLTSSSSRPIEVFTVVSSDNPQIEDLRYDLRDFQRIHVIDRSEYVRNPENLVNPRYPDLVDRRCPRISKRGYLYSVETTKEYLQPFQKSGRDSLTYVHMPARDRSFPVQYIDSCQEKIEVRCPVFSMFEKCFEGKNCSDPIRRELLFRGGERILERSNRYSSYYPPSVSQECFPGLSVSSCYTQSYSRLTYNSVRIYDSFCHINNASFVDSQNFTEPFNSVRWREPCPDWLKKIFINEDIACHSYKIWGPRDKGGYGTQVVVAQEVVAVQNIKSFTPNRFKINLNFETSVPSFAQEAFSNQVTEDLWPIKGKGFSVYELLVTVRAKEFDANSSAIAHQVNPSYTSVDHEIYFFEPPDILKDRALIEINKAYVDDSALFDCQTRAHIWTHEMAHVLGLGHFPSELVQKNNTHGFFIGERAMAAYGGNPVPLGRVNETGRFNHFAQEEKLWPFGPYSKGCSVSPVEDVSPVFLCALADVGGWIIDQAYLDEHCPIES